MSPYPGGATDAVTVPHIADGDRRLILPEATDV